MTENIVVFRVFMFRRTQKVTVFATKIYKQLLQAANIKRSAGWVLSAIMQMNFKILFHLFLFDIARAILDPIIRFLVGHAHCYTAYLNWIAALL